MLKQKNIAFRCPEDTDAHRVGRGVRVYIYNCKIDS